MSTLFLFLKNFFPKIYGKPALIIKFIFSLFNILNIFGSFRELIMLNFSVIFFATFSTKFFFAKKIYLTLILFLKEFKTVKPLILLKKKATFKSVFLESLCTTLYILDMLHQLKNLGCNQVVF